MNYQSGKEKCGANFYWPILHSELHETNKNFWKVHPSWGLKCQGSLLVCSPVSVGVARKTLSPCVASDSWVIFFSYFCLISEQLTWHKFDKNVCTVYILFMSVCPSAVKVKGIKKSHQQSNMAVVMCGFSPFKLYMDKWIDRSIIFLFFLLMDPGVQHCNEIKISSISYWMNWTIE